MSLTEDHVYDLLVEYRNKLQAHIVHNDGDAEFLEFVRTEIVKTERRIEDHPLHQK